MTSPSALRSVLELSHVACQRVLLQDVCFFSFVFSLHERVLCRDPEAGDTHPLTDTAR